MKILIHNPERFPGEETVVEGMVRWLADRESLPETVSVAFVEADVIARWNEEHRGRNGPTDVLSYRYDTEGEILFCPAVVDQLIERENRPAMPTYWEVLLHGLLHLAGYDHEEDKGDHLNRQEQLLEDWFRDHPEPAGEVEQA